MEEKRPQYSCLCASGFMLRSDLVNFNRGDLTRLDLSRCEEMCGLGLSGLDWNGLDMSGV